MSFFHKFVEFSKAMFTILPKIICPCSNKSPIRWKIIGLVGTSLHAIEKQNENVQSWRNREARKRNNSLSQKYLNFVLSSDSYFLSNLTAFLNSLILKTYKLTLCWAKSVKKWGFQPLFNYLWVCALGLCFFFLQMPNVGRNELLPVIDKYHVLFA